MAVTEAADMSLAHATLRSVDFAYPSGHRVPITWDVIGSALHLRKSAGEEWNAAMSP